MSSKILTGIGLYFSTWEWFGFVESVKSKKERKRGNGLFVLFTRLENSHGMQFLQCKNKVKVRGEAAL